LVKSIYIITLKVQKLCKLVPSIGHWINDILTNRDFKTIEDFNRYFSDEQTCIEHLEALRWNGVVTSPFDKYSKVYKCKDNRYRCKNTGKYFNVKTNTIMDNSRISIRKWILAFWYVTSFNTKITSVELGKELGITQKSAWSLLQKIKYTLD